MPCQLTDADELPVGGHGGSAAGPAGVADLAADVAEGRGGQAPLGSFTYDVPLNFGTFGPPLFPPPCLHFIKTLSTFRPQNMYIF